jgi:tRNA (guanine37-N1)-methyltransferase
MKNEPGLKKIEAEKDPLLFFDILTLFPGMFAGVLDESIVKRAMEKRVMSVQITNLRDYASDKHATADDYLYGGIPGMLMKCEVLAKAIRAKKEERKGFNPKVIFLSPKGILLNHQTVQKLAQEKSLILLCGRYKGIDQRIVESLVDMEISVGDYVVSGGELPAMMLVDAITRLLPGALGEIESAVSDSHFDGLLESPNYTRPEVFEGMRVPEVLLSGHHANILKWRKEQSISVTKEKRPDLYEEWLKNK